MPLIPVFILIAAAASLGMIFLDYHKKENRHKAILYVISFIALLLIFKIILLPLFSFYIVLAVPVLLFIYLLLSKRS
jgi:hypothetical protein